MAPESTSSRALRANRELVLAGAQVWQALTQLVGRDGAATEATVLFTELCGFSSWVLEAGDELALELLREVASVVEPVITGHRGKVVKRLGDGHMAVFSTAGDGLAAALDIQEQIAEVRVTDYRPRLRCGLHRGEPRQLGRDYLGADVNIAARLAAAAKAGEVLVSADVLATIGVDERERLKVKRRRAFRAKGAPSGLQVFRVTRV